MISKTEIVVRKDNTIYGEYDYIDILQLKLDIINNKIKEQLYFRNEHGGIDKIDEFGCSYYKDFSYITKLLHEVIKAQMNRRISRRRYKQYLRTGRIPFNSVRFHQIYRN